MNKVDLSPRASALIQSLRSIGYSLNSAIADIVDNSIDAQAKNIRINITSTQKNKVVVAISDDGQGMSKEDLEKAMSLGSTSPEEHREANNLGRFGMGLKTASFSQAKKLTVLTKQTDTDWESIRWNLDDVANSNNWLAEVLDRSEIEHYLVNQKPPLSNGTIVIWEECDRLLSSIPDKGVTDKLLGDLLIQLKNHLSLVFHKFLSGKNKINFWVNDVPISPRDPFCIDKGSSEKATSVEVFKDLDIGDGVSVKGFLIPHPKRYESAENLHRVTPNGDFLAAQGIYIYRGDRLLSWGDWHRMAPRSQANKLARVEINIPNSLDTDWSLDIKKSKVEIPALIKNKLKPKISKLVNHSYNNHRGRTTKPTLAKNPIWVRTFDHESNAVAYVLNKDHQLVKMLSKSLSQASSRELKALLELVECSFPVDLIANDIGAKVTVGLGYSSDAIPDPLKDAITSLFFAGIEPDVIYEQLLGDEEISKIDATQLKIFIDQLVM